MQQKVLSLISNAGGVGKTTIILNLAYLLWSCFGLSVAILDLDNNASIYDFTGLDIVDRQFSIERVFEEDFDGDWSQIQLELFESKGKVVLIPGSESFSESLIASQRRREYILQKQLKKYPLPYDVLILDNRGGLDNIVINSLTSATHLLIPCRVGAKSLTVSRLLGKVWDSIVELQIEPVPQLLGVLPNERVKTHGTHTDVLEILGDVLHEQDIKLYPEIPNNGWVERSNISQIPLAAYRPGESIVSTFKKVAEDLVNAG